MIRTGWTFSRGLCLLLVLGFFAGCDFNGKVPLSGTVPKAKPAGPLWEEPQFTTMWSAFRQALPGKRKVLSFSVSADSAQIRVQDPAKPENVDAYGYDASDGKVKGPTPVVLTGSGKLEDSLFDLDQVAVDRIPELAKAALQKLPLEGGKILGVNVARNEEVHTGDFSKGMGVTFTHNIEMRVDLQGTRRLGSVTADEKGNIVSTNTV